MRILIILMLCWGSAFASSERVFKAFLTFGIDSTSAKIFTAQAVHESGNFTNKLTRNNNNIFAVLHDPYRPTTSIGNYGKAEGRSGYASYASIEAAVADFILFMGYWGISLQQSSISLYCSRLKRLVSPKSGKIRQYYTAPEELYRTALTKHYNKLWKT